MPAKTMGDRIPELVIERERCIAQARDVADALRERVREMRKEKLPNGHTIEEFLAGTRQRVKKLNEEIVRCASTPTQTELC